MAYPKKDNDHVMHRSVVQAMYRYLPGRWVDFYIKGSRQNYSAYVTNWNSEKLEKANIDRIKRAVWMRLAEVQDEFRKGFAPLNEPSSWAVMTPKTAEDQNNAVITNVSPLFFFCSEPSCRRTYQYRTSNACLNESKKCPTCKKGTLTQIRMIYYCNCGWAGPVEEPLCPNQCHKPFRQAGTYTYICTGCKRAVELHKVCPTCGKLLMPRNALDTAQFYPHSISLIDLVDHEKEEYINNQDAGCYIVIARWLGLLSQERYEEAIRFNLYGASDTEQDARIAATVENLRKHIPGMPEELYIKIAKDQLQISDSPNQEIANAIQQAKHHISVGTSEQLHRIALTLLEYDEVLNPPSHDVLTLSEAAPTAVEMCAISDESDYTIAAQKAGFSHVQASGRVPFIMAVYGYSRKENQITNKGTCLCAFSRENATRSNIYATRMETEGVLFELDRRMILSWLVSLHVIDSLEYQESMSDEEVKAWFLNNMNSANIPMYNNIDEAAHPRFFKVYRLLHSISHILIKQAASVCGLDKNSLSEYLFCEIPAVFIYCQNSQGFNLGAMFSAVEAQFADWVRMAMTEVNQCIFDPVCLSETGACAGCLYLNDVSCVHFNKDLDRRLLIGYTNPSTGNHEKGFWEE